MRTMTLCLLVCAAQQRLTIAAVDAQATKGDEAWTEEEEQELVKLVNDEEYRKVRTIMRLATLDSCCQVLQWAIITPASLPL